jgi:N6-adenosine-specific RNA methylase IME4/ParB-like chromosome segregation protein Spo0J
MRRKRKAPPRRTARPSGRDRKQQIARPSTARPGEQRPIAQIQIGARHRRDLGDVDQLAASIADVGLLHPVVITTGGTLVAGERRLEACKRLGWPSVPVTVLDIDAIVRGEFAENSNRKDFLPSEVDAIRRALEPIERAAAKQRMSKGAKGVENFHTLRGKSRDKIGAFAGMSGRTVQKIATVVEAAQAEPEKFGHLVEDLDRHRGVDRAYRKLCQIRDESRVLALKASTAKFRTLILDPPWKYDADFLGRGAPKYALMEREELLALPLASWAEDNAHLYLWCTNAILPLAVELMAAWGFQHKTVLTWAKPRWGLGAHFRGQTEHVLFGIRGALSTRSDSISTLFEAPVGKHSEKPDRFYEIVRAASYPPYGEAFQRKTRLDFVNLFAAKAEAAE